MQPAVICSALAELRRARGSFSCGDVLKTGSRFRALPHKKERPTASESLPVFHYKNVRTQNQLSIFSKISRFLSGIYWRLFPKIDPEQQLPVTIPGPSHISHRPSVLRTYNASSMLLPEAVCGVPASQALFEIRTCFSCKHDEPEPDFKQAVNSNSSRSHSLRGGEAEQIDALLQNAAGQLKKGDVRFLLCFLLLSQDLAFMVETVERI